VRTVDERVQTLSNVFGHFQALLGIGSWNETDSSDGEGFSVLKILKITPGILTGVKTISNIFSLFAKKKNK
jgi:hypothetical protein